MKSKRSLCLLLLFCATVAAYAQNDTGAFIAHNDKRIGYSGRIGRTDSCAEIYWTGSSVSLNVKGTSAVNALLSDEQGNNYYYVIVDGVEASATKLKIDKEKKLYSLASNLSNGPHRIELFKITNTDYITTRFFGFAVDKAGRVMKASKKPRRKIEFFGNSITCGHGADVPADSADSGAPQYFNNYKAYGAITARHFGAQYHCTAKSGIGITISWFNEVMPELYDRLNPADSTSKWDFALYTPDIVVVNLFQNDSWLVNRPDHEQFKRRFGTTKPTEDFIIAAYKGFIQNLRSRYARAVIICCLGNMDATKEGSPWPGYVERAVASLKDKKIVTHFFAYKKTPGHPKLKEQQAMADDLIAFIKAKGFWK